MSLLKRSRQTRIPARVCRFSDYSGQFMATPESDKRSSYKAAVVCHHLMTHDSRLCRDYFSIADGLPVSEPDMVI